MAAVNDLIANLFPNIGLVHIRIVKFMEEYIIRHMLDKAEQCMVPVQIYVHHISGIQSLSMVHIIIPIDLPEKEAPKFRAVLNAILVLLPFGADPLGPYLLEFFAGLQRTLLDLPISQSLQQFFAITVNIAGSKLWGRPSHHFLDQQHNMHFVAAQFPRKGVLAEKVINVQVQECGQIIWQAGMHVNKQDVLIIL